MNLPKTIAYGLLVFIAVLLWRSSCNTQRETKQDVIQKQAIHRADSSHRAATVNLTKVRKKTDHRLAEPTPIPVDTAQQIVKDEREACDSVIHVDSVQVKTRDKRIKTLERRLGGTVFLYAEGGIDLPLGQPLGVEAEGEAGVALRLRGDLYVQGGVTTHGDVRITGRKQVRIF